MKSLCNRLSILRLFGISSISEMYFRIISAHLIELWSKAIVKGVSPFAPAINGHSASRAYESNYAFP